jgi:hypothetical protein
MKSKISENMQLNLINCHLSMVTFASFYLKIVVLRPKVAVRRAATRVAPSSPPQP